MNLIILYSFWLLIFWPEGTHHSTRDAYSINPLDSEGNYSATSNKLVHSGASFGGGGLGVSGPQGFAIHFYHVNLNCDVTWKTVTTATTLRYVLHLTSNRSSSQFWQLILRKIIKIVATRCQILRPKCTKFDFGWGSAQTPLGELTALPGPLSWI